MKAVELRAQPHALGDVHLVELEQQLHRRHMRLREVGCRRSLRILQDGVALLAQVDLSSDKVRDPASVSFALGTVAAVLAHGGCTREYAPT
jgi:hypothetical protein